MLFNPLPSSEGRHCRKTKVHGSTILQSTSLIRGKTPSPGSSLQFHILQSTSLIRGKTYISANIAILLDSSIHFPHPREDLPLYHPTAPRAVFNPLPSSEGRRHDGGAVRAQRIFNPLPSSEGRRLTWKFNDSWEILQSTSLIRGKTGVKGIAMFEEILQSTSLIRGKTLLLIPLSESAHLQSTSLIRGKTAFIGGEYAETISSIHFPHPREDAHVWERFFESKVLQSTSLIRGKTGRKKQT